MPNPTSAAPSLYAPLEILAKPRYQPYLAYPGGARPISLFCETVNLCNNSCIICAYDKQTRPKGTMSMDLFDRVLRDYSEMGGGHMSLTPVVGDALIDRHLIERVRRCEDFPKISGLSFTTNAAVADLLGDEDLAYLLSRLRRIYISVYGIDEAEYRVMTRRDTYQRLLSGVDRILRFATGEVVIGFRLLHRRAPDATLRWVEQFPAWRETRAAVSIGEPVYTYANWGVFDIKSALPGDARWSELPVSKVQCLVPLLGCQVFWNGNVSWCPCDDFDNHESLHLGSLHDATLGELFNTDKSRRLWNWAAHGIPEFCKTCSFHIPLSDVEKHGDIFADPLILAGA